VLSVPLGAKILNTCAIGLFAKLDHMVYDVHTIALATHLSIAPSRQELVLLDDSLTLDEQVAYKLIEKFIARPDVKAIQNPRGYQPHGTKDRDGNYTGYYEWTLEDVLAHLAGTKTFGHYLLDKDNTCKLFAFDIDLNKTGMIPTLPMPEMYEGNSPQQLDDDAAGMWTDSFQERDLIAAWHNREDPARPYLKHAMKSYAHVLQRAIVDLQIPSAVAYSGNKGVHVYGFCGRMPAEEVRIGAKIALDSLPMEPIRGDIFWAWNDNETFQEHKLFTVEVFPKQDTISNEGGFGNLMRLPLGVNLKNPEDPTFFVDMDTTRGVLSSIDPLVALDF